MSLSAFEVISNYCIESNIDFPIRNQAYAIYTQKHKETIENHKKSNANNITPKERKTIETALVSDSSIGEYIASAIQIISDIKQTAIAPYKNKFKWGEFWISVGASVVGAFLFLLLLIVLIYVAEEQIKSIVAPLVYEETNSTNEKVNPNDALKRDAEEADAL